MGTDNLTTPSKRLNPLNDYLFLKVMGEKGDEAQLLGFLNTVLECSGNDRFRSVEIIENKSLTAEYIGDKTSILDVRAQLGNKDKINIEVQLYSQAYFDRRLLFSWSRVYTEGMKAGQSYRDLPNVIAINIMDFDFPPNESYYACYHLRDGVNPLRILSRALEIHCIDMTKWRKLATIDIKNNSLHRWLAWFDHNSPPELIEEVITMDDAIQAANERQAHVCLDEEARALYWRRQMGIMDQIELAREHEDYENGLREALKEGLEKGRETTMLNIARNALAKGLSNEVIHEITGLDMETMEKLGK